MRKGKNMALLLLAAGIIAACALLPGVVASYQDSTAIGQPHFETVPNIQLQIRGEEETPAMAKLAMIARMDGGLEISKSMASMTQEEAEERALEILEEYVDVGLVDPFDPVVLDGWCMMATVTTDPSLNGVYWMMTLVSADEKNYAQFDLAVDDQSGAVLAVSFTSERIRHQEEREALLSGFADYYFNRLGIPDYAAFVTEDMENQYIGENNCAVRYRFGDAVYGEINVDLYVHEYGFYTEFPNLGVDG